jgi:hypothetical protein
MSTGRSRRDIETPTRLALRYQDLPRAGWRTPSAASAQMVWLSQSDTTNVFNQFCPQANMFCDTALLQAWQEASELLGRALDLADAAALGRDSWTESAYTDPSL